MTRLKAQPLVYPSIDVSYAPSEPLTAPVVLNLPANGLRLRFDGPEQTLRLIEVLDFACTQLCYKKIDLVKLSDPPNTTSVGPTFRHVYNTMGPTFPGEYLPPSSSSRKALGSYVLSYPGIAFSFPLENSAWKPELDHVSLLSSSAAFPSKSIAIYEGSSWQEVRKGLLYPKASGLGIAPSPSRSKDHRAVEIEIVNIHGNGKLELVRRSSPPLQILLGETTTQDLVMELGPPDAIYYKNDHRLSIHSTRRPSHQQHQPYPVPPSPDHEMTDTDHSFAQTSTDNSDEEEDTTGQNGNPSAECFYNYFHYGFDIYVSYPTNPSQPFPTKVPEEQEHPRVRDTNRLVATKVILHGNVPGSYPFNRYRRIRWAIDIGDSAGEVNVLNSETPFTTLSESLQRMWKGAYDIDGGEIPYKGGMVLNRGWGDSPSDSCELLGGWEESADTIKRGSNSGIEGPGSGNTELSGFPGLVFEVLRNDAVSCLTIY